MPLKVIENTLTVSIIVPVYNHEKYVQMLIESLLNQDYPKELFEIIVVDNNSKDKIENFVKKYPVRFLKQNKIQSSYATRNKGIESAKHNILAFIDADCIPSPQWLKEGVNALLSGSSDLVGGKIEFYYSDKKTAAEMYDSMIHFRNEYNIKELEVACTSNLFVKRFVFEKIGLFPNEVKSGGDFQWTHKATEIGYSLTYCSDAIIKHPARSLTSLLKKNFRTGIGLPFILLNKGESLIKPRFLFRMMLPLKFSYIKSLIKQRGTKDMNSKSIRIWLVSYFCGLFHLSGFFLSIIFIFSRKKTMD
jgi:glycosyltransferase involved in cell wall biosynthesis